jgi:glucokinase
VTAAAEDGDLVARQAFASVGDWLGVGLAGLVAAFDPEVVVVGGGVSAAGDRLLDPARIALRRALVGAEHRAVPEIRVAHFGPEAGLVGAALLAAERDRQPRTGG